MEELIVVPLKTNGYPGLFRRKIDPEVMALFFSPEKAVIVTAGTNSSFKVGEHPNWLNVSKWEPISGDVHFISQNPNGIF